jgi:hypothetical protein
LGELKMSEYSMDEGTYQYAVIHEDQARYQKLKINWGFAHIHEQI